jgi:hypothetical protein
MVRLLEAFVDQNGRLPKRTPARTAEVPEGDQHERMLSMWCANQRRFERAATVERPYPEERRARLDRVRGWSWAKPQARGRRRQNPGFVATLAGQEQALRAEQLESEPADIEQSRYAS